MKLDNEIREGYYNEYVEAGKKLHVLRSAVQNACELTEEDKEIHRDITKSLVEDLTRLTKVITGMDLPAVRVEVENNLRTYFKVFKFHEGTEEEMQDMLDIFCDAVYDCGGIVISKDHVVHNTLEVITLHYMAKSSVKLERISINIV